MHSQKKIIKVVSFGDLVADIITYIPSLPAEAGKHQVASKVQIEPGGAGNFLIAGARIGLQMDSLAALGNDSIGGAVRTIFEEEGILTRGIVQQVDGSTTSVIVLTDQSGQHVFLGEVGKGPTLELSETWKNIIDECDAFHAWGYTFHEERLESAMREAISYARSQDKPVFFDPGPFMGDASRDQLDFVLDNCTHIMMTQDEIPFIIREDSNETCVADLLSRNPIMICVKKGAEGCVIYTKDGSFAHPGYKVKMVDTNGAGDSFDAAFIFGYLQEWHPEKMAAFANAMGAAKVQKLGSGRQVPRAEEINAVLDENKVGFRL